MSKLELLKYVDDALHYGRDCYSRRGRKKKAKQLKNQHQSEGLNHLRDEEVPPKMLPSISTVLDAVKVSQDKQYRPINISFPSAPINFLPFKTNPDLPSPFNPIRLISGFQSAAYNGLSQSYSSIHGLAPQIVIMTPEFPIAYQTKNVSDKGNFVQSLPLTSSLVRTGPSLQTRWFHILVANKYMNQK